MSTLYVDTITEKTAGNGVQIADLVPAAGSVVQVVQGQNTVRQTISSSSFVTSGLDVNITPTSSSSKILVIAQTSGNSESANRSLKYTLYRDSTNLGGTNGLGLIESPQARLQTPLVASILDSPSTTSQITYSLYVSASSSIVEVPATPNAVSSIIVMEIAQ